MQGRSTRLISTLIALLAVLTALGSPKGWMPGRDGEGRLGLVLCASFAQLPETASPHAAAAQHVDHHGQHGAHDQHGGSPALEQLHAKSPLSHHHSGHEPAPADPPDHDGSHPSQTVCDWAVQQAAPPATPPPTPEPARIDYAARLLAWRPLPAPDLPRLAPPPPSTAPPLPV